MKSSQVVIFANSFKHNQHCVAGKLINSSQWVRPVSNKQGGELSHQQAMSKNPHGKFNVKPLQKVIMGFASHVPLINQPENYLIDNSTWQQNYCLNIDELTNYLDTPSDIWGEGDRVLYSQIQSQQVVISQSLFLIQVNKLNLYKNQYNKRRASFSYNGINYDLAVTDPNFDNIFTDLSGLKKILCISLGEVFEGNCFKLVATVF